uniref:TRAF3-interacting protein 1 n=1 Tax=Monopterus albus TaxID=43700 RepID=A0A3Q3KEW3_MONAL
MNAAVVRKTQDTLGKVIKKPPLTEKLLIKPPTTGFMKGLYGDNEMKSDNVKDKDSKIAYLQKAIDVVMLVSGESLAAKPARIVAGHEPEKTNELLQAIAKCCLNKVPSDDAVKRVLTGEKVDMKTKASTSRSQDKENREGREHLMDREEKKRITERSGSQEQKDPDQPKEQDSRRRDREKERHRDRERPDKHHRSEQDHGKDRSRDKDRDKGRVKDRDKEKDNERDRERDRDKERERTRERDSHRDWERDKEKRRDKEREKERGPEELSKTTKPVPAVSSCLSPARIPRPSSAKGQRRRPKPGGQGKPPTNSFSPQHPIHVPQESGDTAGSSVPSVGASRQISRPSSARPAPPRLKKQETYKDAASAERLSSAKHSAPLIMDGKKLSEDEEDEDEQFLVEETLPPPSGAPEMTMVSVLKSGEEKHGGLVIKILETKKDYELSSSSPKSKEQNLVSEAARKKERDMVTRETERLRSSIQAVCRSTLPLGKIMDYIQEDMDAMQAELHTWRRENKEHAQALLQEQRVTDQSVEPLKAELSELEQLVKDQQDKICAVRSNILRNEEKIQKMVTGINFSSRTNLK